MGIELDIRLSRDGEMVVIHDERVDRTTDGSGRVEDMTLRELEQLKIQPNEQSSKNQPAHGIRKIFKGNTT